MALSFASEQVAPAPLLRADGLTLMRPGSRVPVLEHVSVALAPGECVLLEGATGAGKSTLLRALAGLEAALTRPDGALTGRDGALTGRDGALTGRDGALTGLEGARAGAIERRGRVALLFQHVETQLLCTTVEEEVALGPRSAGLPEAQVEERVRASLAALGMTSSRRQSVDALSAGQRQRVVLCALLAVEPRVLLLDEPGSALDAPSRRALARVLRELTAKGMAVLVADHDPRELAEVCDRALVIEQGRLREGSPPRGCEAREVAPAARPSGREQRFSIDPVTADPVELARRIAPLRAGERVLLTGPNGAGKSTCLRALARHRYAVAGRFADAALVIQEPRRSLFARSTAEEVEFALRRRGVPARARRCRVEALLERIDLLAAAERSPLRLSFGQQHRLAIAAALAASPKLVLLDEPFAGLDARARRALVDWLVVEQEASGAAVVIATHDREPLMHWCDRVVVLEGSGGRDV